MANEVAFPAGARCEQLGPVLWGQLCPVFWCLFPSRRGFCFTNIILFCWWDAVLPCPSCIPSMGWVGAGLCPAMGCQGHLWPLAACPGLSEPGPLEPKGSQEGSGLLPIAESNLSGCSLGSAASVWEEKGRAGELACRLAQLPELQQLIKGISHHP